MKLRKCSFRSSPLVPQLLFCLDLIQLEGCNFLCWMLPLAIYCCMHWNIWLVTLNKTTKHGNINNWYTQTKICVRQIRSATSHSVVVLHLQMYKNKVNKNKWVSLLPPREGLVLITGWKLEKYVTEHKIKHTHKNKLMCIQNL